MTEVITRLSTTRLAARSATQRSSPPTLTPTAYTSAENISLDPDPQAAIARFNCRQTPNPQEATRPGGTPGANLKSISHRCNLREVAFEWELNKETIYLPLGSLQRDDLDCDPPTRGDPLGLQMVI